MILKDTEREFGRNSRIGFGVDGDEQTRDADFAAIRGTYEDNSFVQSIRQETIEVNERAKTLISKLAN